MSARNQTQRFKRLVSHGYFAPELPPCFVSHDLARYRESIWREIEAVPPAHRRQQGGARAYISEPTSFYFPRFNRNDRKHGVLNPVSYLAISKTIAAHFVELRRVARSSSISVSPLVFDWSGARALVRPGIDLRDNFRVELANRCTNLVAADVRAFFHSIYTHAIPWAIYGKSWAKQNRGFQDYGNKLDLFCRNSQDGQTIGLPVGPDTSRLIAEVIASAIDAKLIERLELQRGQASRYVDDFTIAVIGDRRSDEVLAAVRQSVAEFELELNADKSISLETSTRFPTGWKQAVLSYVPRSDRSLGSFERFFYEVGRVCREQPEINVEKFAFQNARRAFVNAEDWPQIQSHLISSYRRNSTLVSFIAEIFILRQVQSADVELEAIRDFLEIWIDELAREDRTGEIIWLLFMAYRLQIELRASRIAEVFKIENGLIALMVTYGSDAGHISGDLQVDLWAASLTPSGLRSPMWLYVYETLQRDIAPTGSRQILLNDPYFAKISKSGVNFFDIDAGFTSIGETMTGLRGENRRVSMLQDDFLSDFEFDLDEFDPEEDEDLDDFEEYSEEY